MRDYRQSPSFWTNALLSQRKTLIGSSMAICQHLSKTRQPLSTLDIIIISVNMADKLQACLEKIPNITSLKQEQTQAVGALLAGKDVLAILPGGFGKSLIYQVFSMAQTSANASVLVISPLNTIVEEQAKEMNGLGIRSVHLKPDIEDCLHDISDGHFRMIFASAEDCLSKRGAEPHSLFSNCP